MTSVSGAITTTTFQETPLEDGDTVMVEETTKTFDPDTFELLSEETLFYEQPAIEW